MADRRKGLHNGSGGAGREKASHRAQRNLQPAHQSVNAARVDGAAPAYPRGVG